MRKIWLFFLIFVILIFLIPTFFTQYSIPTTAKAVETNYINETANNEENEQYDYKNFSTIKLLHKGDGSVQEINLDEYLLGVVSSEMPATFEQEALNAQSLVARTYTIYMIKNGKKHEEADICDDSNCCQAWISKE